MFCGRRFYVTSLRKTPAASGLCRLPSSNCQPDDRLEGKGQRSCGLDESDGSSGQPLPDEVGLLGDLDVTRDLGERNIERRGRSQQARRVTRAPCLHESAVVYQDVVPFCVLDFEDTGASEGIPHVAALDSPRQGAVTITNPPGLFVAPLARQSGHSSLEGVEQQSRIAT